MNTSIQAPTNPNKKVLRGGITIQRIPRKIGAKVYYSKDWHMRIQIKGRRSWIKLGQDIKTATAKAYETVATRHAGGIAAELSIQEPKVSKPSGEIATIGELVDQIELSTGVFDMAAASTVHEYLLSLTLVVREVTEHKLGRKLEDHEVRDIPSSCLTAGLVRDFRNLRSQGVPEGPASKTVRRTANTHLRNAQAAVPPMIMDHLRDKGMNIPDLTPFRSSPLFKDVRVVYVLPPAEVIVRVAKAIREELGSRVNPLFYLAALLALHAGLRRKEIVHAKWSWFEVSGQPVIRVLSEAGFTPKGNRGRRIKITRWLFNELHKYKRPGSEYILEGSSRWWVNNELHGLVQWIRSQGITAEKAIHELRKLFGAFLAGYYDLTVAQRQLGHSTPLITNDFYAGIDHFNYALAKFWEQPELTASFEEIMAHVEAANQGKVDPPMESAFGFRRFN